MTKRKLITTLLFLCAGMTVLAQYNPSERYVPPSPNAAALAKFIDIPVNLHTGVPKVNIPIHNWTNAISGLSLNISLDYHAGGVKVEEVASSVGLGWALSAGGVITRTMRGRPDEDALGFLNTPILPDIATTAYDGQHIQDQNYSSYYAVNAMNSNADFQTVINIDNNSADGAQDIFYYNFNGKSGKFFIGKDGSILVQTRDNLKINPIQIGTNKLSRFEIIDENGILYIFRDIEQTTSISNTMPYNGVPSQSAQIEYASSWYLSEIKSADRQTGILFEYDGGFQMYNTGYSETKSINFNMDPLNNTPSGHTNSHNVSYSSLNIYALRLKKITFPNQIFVELQYSGSRSDLDGGYMLDKIIIKDASEEFGFTLTHNYIDGRLQLVKLQKSSESHLENPYHFQYRGGLPARSSMYQDYWGYAIGNSRNISTRISKIHLTNNQAYDPFLDGSDRRPDPNGVLAGSLEKITYPTGGSTFYEMECNDAYDQSNYYVNEKVVGPAHITKASTNMPHYLSFQELTGNEVNFKIMVTETSRATPGDGTPVWWIEDDIDNNPVNIVLSSADGSWSTTIYSGTYGQVRSAAGIYVNGQTVPTAGSYSINMQMNTMYPIDFDAYISGSFYIEPQKKYVGGIRVKTINTYLDAAGTALAFSQKYSYLEDNGHSSGKLATVPNFSFYFNSILQWYNCGWPSGPGTLNLVNRTSEATQPLGAVQGSPVGYAKVVVEQINSQGASNGSIVYKFSPLVYHGYQTTYPFLAGEYISWGAGLPISEQTYSASGTLQRSTENLYDISYLKHNSEQHRSLKTGLIFSDNCNTVQKKQFAVAVEYPVYGISLKQLQIDQVIEDGKVVETRQNFAYNPVYHQVFSVSKTTNDGSMTTKYYYPYDFNSIPSFSNMLNANRIGVPVREEKWRSNSGGDRIIGATATGYQDFDSSGFPRPNVVYAFDLSMTAAAPVHNPTILINSPAYYPSERFYKYTSKGAPLSMGRENSAVHSFLWAADGLNAKAAIANALAEETYYEDFEQTGVLGNAHGGNKHSGGSYTVNWTRPNARDYIISYWYFDTTWKYRELPYTANSMILSQGTLYDDIRIHPSDAEMTTFNYKPLTGLSSHIDAKGMTTYYGYDGFGRLKWVKDQAGNIIKENSYHYKN